MKTYNIATAVAIFMLGGLVGHIITAPSSVSAATEAAQISTFELTMKASNLPVQTFDAI